MGRDFQFESTHMRINPRTRVIPDKKKYSRKEKHKGEGAGMTVKQLRAKLEKMPQDAEVEYYDGDNGWTIIDSVNHEDNIRSYI